MYWQAVVAQTWSSFNKERMSHLCERTVAGLTTRRDSALANANTRLSVTPPPPEKRAPIVARSGF